MDTSLRGNTQTRLPAAFCCMWLWWIMSSGKHRRELEGNYSLVSLLGKSNVMVCHLEYLSLCSCLYSQFCTSIKSLLGVLFLLICVFYLLTVGKVAKEKKMEWDSSCWTGYKDVFSLTFTTQELGVCTYWYSLDQNKVDWHFKYWGKT